MQEKLNTIKHCLQQRLQIENFVTLDSLFSRLEVDLANNPQTAVALENQLIQLLQTTSIHDLYFLYLMSAMLKLFGKAQYLRLLLDGSLCSSFLSEQNLEFLEYQVASILFRHPELTTPDITDLAASLHERVLDALKAKTHITPIPKEQRNPNRVIVMTPNFLSERHAPTHSTLERSYTLKTIGNAEVHIISTTEGASATGRLPVYHGYVANKIDAYAGVSTYTWHGEAFPLYQPTGSINTPDTLQQLLDYVAEVAPYYIVYVGGRSYVADILNDYCPVVTVSTVFSTIPSGNTSFAMVGRQITEAERQAHFAEIIEVPFSFELTEKKRNHTRKELGIPEDAFVMAVVGNRLDADLKADFFEVIERVEHGFLLLLGNYSTYTEQLKKHPWLKEHSVSLGFVDDVIGVLECADLYVNPQRLGGGFSVIEAFQAGIPAVTPRYGDVSVAAGAAFCVDSYDEMYTTICRYQSDAAFYQNQLRLAEQRKNEITDGSSFYEKGIKKLLDSKRFY